MSTEKRLEKLEALARQRMASTPKGYMSVAEFHDGVYECSYVSPYTKAAHNPESKVLIIHQDWISADVLAGPIIPDAVSGGRIPMLPTNRNLDRLLKESIGLRIDEAYATNLFPFVKPGGMSSSISFPELRASARNYAIPQIEILSPRLVVALGLVVYNAIAAESNQPRQPTLAEAIAHPFEVGDSRVWCQAHPGALGQNSRNRFTKNQTSIDWLEMATWHKTQNAT